MINLNVNGISFSYNGHAVLEDVSFQVKKGELLAILGPNGAGKTTLLKCINAIHRPKRGSVLIGEHHVLKLSSDEIARLFGYVPQRVEAARLTVFDSILMGRKPYIKWRVRNKDVCIVDAAIKRLSLEHLSLRYIDRLSGGELQKVSIARALVQEPDVLLLDEPTASLDLRNQLDILRTIRGVVKGHQVSAIMTMHDLNTALRYADKFLFLKDGCICDCGGCEIVTPEIIEMVYGVPVEIEQRNGHPIIYPIEDPDNSRVKAIH
ncbi:MAG: iron complex transport system ATP-binding protein [Desulforhopalus sp.]|jgi:iron complex transport system ATP-binding protein